jgi:hypothetical protein
LPPLERSEAAAPAAPARSPGLDSGRRTLGYSVEFG